MQASAASFAMLVPGIVGAPTGSAKHRPVGVGWIGLRLAGCRFLSWEWHLLDRSRLAFEVERFEQIVELVTVVTGHLRASVRAGGSGESGGAIVPRIFLNHFPLLAEIRPTDVWDGGDVIGAVLLVAIIVGVLAVVYVIRRR